MANEIRQAKKGLAGALSVIDGLRVFGYEPESVNELPAAIVGLESRELAESLGSDAIRGSMRVEVLVSATDARWAEESLTAFVEPKGDCSIEAAARADPTWGGAVDDGRLVGVDNIGRRKVGGTNCVGAEFHFWFVRSGYGTSSGLATDSERSTTARDKQ